MPRINLTESLLNTMSEIVGIIEAGDVEETMGRDGVKNLERLDAWIMQERAKRTTKKATLAWREAYLRSFPVDREPKYTPEETEEEK
tara:strand:+ start:118 stop:378 length:261 start_codon:yes stop_codon:yes gene_type:complete